ncbi:transcriptional regulator TyrR [Photobacterium carnosum]|uniref:transcriptional regulator TyrR n=1 Tax=Photobacterium carnosum TaxID=2023717 RepID=UPI00128CACD6|nr:transcriptional regulator TyrR [Photobacterium carnosum]KAE8178698.1 DNA-binding transcriptional regulator TyrR [Photobacterium carnosum]MBY3787001.1 transcriptional regulator TyrR [Photobacterium carnosum]MCD9494008.1 transcriptional regulator TyrR [Photobacterium carnosum]MCD9497501.1 transcriptional regulator TyrR [Photobacterium carnosum]MCD9532792.1 transcriptional regulator TyrR [Photobacterium carnosum]
MRLQVFCEDRVGMTRELLDILTSQDIDLRGIEIDRIGIIYLNCPEVEFEQFSQLMSQIRQLDGVTDVRKIQFMPSEREHTELSALLQTLPDPFFTINLNGKVDFANQAAEQLMGHRSDDLFNENIHSLLGFNFSRWLDKDQAKKHSEIVVISGLDYQMDIMPVFVSDDAPEPVLVSALILLKSLSEAKMPMVMRSIHGDSGFEHFIGHSSRFKHLLGQAKKLALLDAPLLIQGETGTGKEMLARACHQRSVHRDKPFLVVNCISMPDNAAETELFGCIGSISEPAKKGIFEQAAGGTVFLYEIGEMSKHLQIKLLRFLQDGTFRRVGEEAEIKVSVRVICSTQKRLLDLVADGAFREDLYYRLNVLALVVPPLRERAADIVPLAELFLTQFSQELYQPKPILSEELALALKQYAWPGNIRQLRNVLFRAMTQVEGAEMTSAYVQLPENESTTVLSEEILTGSLDEIMKRYESGILSNLYQSYPSTRKLAKRLGVSHTAVANKLREYGLSKRN